MIRPVYEAANNPLTKVLVMVLYRGLEHLIKAFYSVCLILNRSLNCRTSKCQCSLNIYVPCLRKEIAEMAKTEREGQATVPSSFEGKGLGMMISYQWGCERDVAIQSAPHLCAGTVVEKTRLTNHMAAQGA